MYISSHSFLHEYSNCLNLKYFSAKKHSCCVRGTVQNIQRQIYERNVAIGLDRKSSTDTYSKRIQQM